MPLCFFFFWITRLRPWCQRVIGRVYWSSALVVTSFSFPNSFIPPLGMRQSRVCSLGPSYKSVGTAPTADDVVIASLAAEEATSGASARAERFSWQYPLAASQRQHALGFLVQGRSFWFD